MRIDADTLREMAGLLSTEDRDEMAIPSFLHRNPALRWMAWRRVEVVAELLARVCPTGGRVLDFGCGTGVLFEAALDRAAEVIGVDLVLTAATLWKERKHLDRVRLLDPERARTEVETGSVDVVVAAEVLEHIDDPDRDPGLLPPGPQAGWLPPRQPPDREPRLSVRATVGRVRRPLPRPQRRDPRRHPSGRAASGGRSRGRSRCPARCRSTWSPGTPRPPGAGRPHDPTASTPRRPGHARGPPDPDRRPSVPGDGRGPRAAADLPDPPRPVDVGRRRILRRGRPEHPRRPRAVVDGVAVPLRLSVLSLPHFGVPAVALGAGVGGPGGRSRGRCPTGSRSRCRSWRWARRSGSGGACGRTTCSRRPCRASTPATSSRSGSRSTASGW